MRNKESAYLRTDKRIESKVNKPALEDRLTLPNQEQSAIHKYPELALALNAGSTQIRSGLTEVKPLS